jgi:hypothetical protein
VVVPSLWERSLFMGSCRMLLVVPPMLAVITCLAKAQDSPEVKQWQVYEVRMTAAQNAANPYVAYLREGRPARVTVRFAGVSGDAAGRELTVAGFWDGGTSWKARFAPPASGGWAFEPLGGPWSQPRQRQLLRGPREKVIPPWLCACPHGKRAGATSNMPMARLPVDRGHLVNWTHGDTVRDVQESGR